MAHDPNTHPHPIHGSSPCYSTVEDVIAFTGVRPTDFNLGDSEGGLTAQEKLNVMIYGWLVEAKSLIDGNRNRDYTAEGTIPAGIHQIALRIVANMVALAMLRRETPVIRVDNFTVNMVKDEVFTAAIRKDLQSFPAKSRFSMTRVRGRRELD